MPETVNGVFPSLYIVRFLANDVLVTTLPKAKSPSTRIVFETAIPVPEHAMAFSPLVLSDATVIVPP